MAIVTGLYLVALLLITLFTDVIFGVNAQSLAYGPLTLALLVLLYLALTDRPRDFLYQWYTSSPLMAVGLLFLAGLAASLPRAYDVGLAAKDFMRWSFVFLVYAPVTRALCADRRRCALFARTSAGFVILFASLTFADVLTGGRATPALLGREGVTGELRYWSLYENAGIFAGMLMVGYPLALVAALGGRRPWARVGWAVGVAIIAVGMLVSGSRAAVISAAVATAAIAIAQRRWWLLGTVMALTVAAAVLLSAGALTGPSSLERLQQVTTGTGTGAISLRRRLLAWSLAAELIERSPVIGWGGSQLRFHQHAGFNRAHNAWLDAWLDGGLLALVAMLLVTAHVMRRAWATMSRRYAHLLDPTHVALVAASLAVITGWLVRAGIGSRIDWLPIFMLFGLYWERGGKCREGGAAQPALQSPALERGAAPEGR